MAKLIKRRIAASTLPESIIAMMIIMMVFSIAIGICVRIQVSGTSVLSRQVNYKMNELILLNLTGQHNEETIISDSITYQQQITDYKDFPDLELVEIKAERHGQILAVRRAVVKKTRTEGDK